MPPGDDAVKPRRNRSPEQLAERIVPSSARLYGYWPGGKGNHAVGRGAAEQNREILPNAQDVEMTAGGSAEQATTRSRSRPTAASFFVPGDWRSHG